MRQRPGFSALRRSESCGLGFGFGAKPPVTLFKFDVGAFVVPTAWGVVDFFAFAVDVAFDETPGRRGGASADTLKRAGVAAPR